MQDITAHWPLDTETTPSVQEGLSQPVSKGQVTRGSLLGPRRFLAPLPGARRQGSGRAGPPGTQGPRSGRRTQQREHQPWCLMWGNKTETKARGAVWVPTRCAASPGWRRPLTPVTAGGFRGRGWAWGGGRSALPTHLTVGKWWPGGWLPPCPPGPASASPAPGPGVCSRHTRLHKEGPRLLRDTRPPDVRGRSSDPQLPHPCEGHSQPTVWGRPSPGMNSPVTSLPLQSGKP